MSERPLAFLARAVPVVGIAAAAAVIPTVLIVATAGQRVMIAPVVHVVVVGAAGALAAAAAIALSLIAGRLNDSRAVLLGTAFSVMATMLLVHALATPGALVGRNGLMQFAGALNIPVGAAILAASALPALDGRPHRRTRAWIPLGLAAVLAVAGAIALIDPGRIPAVPRPGSALAGLVFAVGAGALTLLAWRAGRTHLLTRRISDLLVTVGLVWLIAAQYGLLHYGMNDPGVVGRTRARGGQHRGSSVSPPRSICATAWRRVRSWEICGAVDLVAGRGGISGGRTSAPSCCASPPRTPRPRVTRAASPRWPCRSANGSGWRSAGCVCSRSAACCTT